MISCCTSRSKSGILAALLVLYVGVGGLPVCARGSNFETGIQTILRAHLNRSHAALAAQGTRNPVTQTIPNSGQDNQQGNQKVCVRTLQTSNQQHAIVGHTLTQYMVTIENVCSDVITIASSGTLVHCAAVNMSDYHYRLHAVSESIYSTNYPTHGWLEHGVERINHVKQSPLPELPNKNNSDNQPFLLLSNGTNHATYTDC